MTEGIDHFNILVAEDDPGIQNLYRKLLPDEAKLHVFGNGQEAATCYEILRDRLDLVITDFNMPGLCGDKLIEFVRVYDVLFHKSRMPILLCTGGGFASLYDVDFDRVLYKPFDLSLFEGTINDLLNLKDDIV